MLAHDLRIEAAGAITGHLDFDFTHGIGEHGFRAGAVAGVAPVASDRIVLVIAQVIRELFFERGLHHGLGQRLEHPIGGVGERDPAGLGSAHQFPGGRQLLRCRRAGHQHIIVGIGCCCHSPMVSVIMDPSRQAHARRVGPLTPKF
ncbi:hypothetical protein MSZK_39650 [Mycobacterium sp. shizuoka-1]|nr:hypothetical protein MSZK_39650 [Mycobacterium sp. shizuoka-1]